MTPLKQQISLIQFSIEHWYSPYKRRRFENRWDQTFCILLIKDVLSVIKSANLCRRQNLKQKKSGFEFGFSDHHHIFGCHLDLDVHRISVPKLWIHSSASFISPSWVQIGWWFTWLYENWENREMLTNVGKSPIPHAVVKNMKNRNPRADPDHHQKSTTSRGSPLARACQVWSTSVSAFVSYPVYRMTERMKEWQKMIT